MLRNAQTLTMLALKIAHPDCSNLWWTTGQHNLGRFPAKGKGSNKICGCIHEMQIMYSYPPIRYQLRQCTQRNRTDIYSITRQNGYMTWLSIVMEKCMNESYHTCSTLEKYASIWGTRFPVRNSIRVVALRVRNTEIIITGTSPTSTTTFGNLVTVRLDHGWQTKGFHWPC